MVAPRYLMALRNPFCVWKNEAGLIGDANGLTGGQTRSQRPFRGRPLLIRRRRAQRHPWYVAVGFSNLRSLC